MKYRNVGQTGITCSVIGLGTHQFSGEWGQSFSNKDVSRLFQYHGAEHKVVYNFESGENISIKNAQLFPTQHPRCGTSFMFIVLLSAIFAFAIVDTTGDENIDGIWTFSNNAKVRSSIIHGTVFNLKRYWCPKNNNIDWSNNDDEFLNQFLYEGSQVKNIWIPYGE